MALALHVVHLPRGEGAGTPAVPARHKGAALLPLSTVPRLPRAAVAPAGSSPFSCNSDLLETLFQFELFRREESSRRMLVLCQIRRELLLSILLGVCSQASPYVFAS